MSCSPRHPTPSSKENEKKTGREREKKAYKGGRENEGNGTRKQDKQREQGRKSRK